jgi:uncharacterized ferritin-like protein (DUF455 family)
MKSKAFVQELESSNQVRLGQLGEMAALAGEAGPPVDIVRLLKIALVNELNVSELAAIWMPSTAEWDIKIALAQQAGDEARHFQLVEARLGHLGISLADFILPEENPLFAYLNSLSTPVERIAAGIFTLESIAYQVNENFIRYCEQFGDTETAKIYKHSIQPDELYHHQMGARLLEKYATTAEAQRLASVAAAKTLDIAGDLRRAAAQKLGTQCFPGC